MVAQDDADAMALRLTEHALSVYDVAAAMSREKAAIDPLVKRYHELADALRATGTFPEQEHGDGFDALRNKLSDPIQQITVSPFLVGLVERIDQQRLARLERERAAAGHVVSGSTSDADADDGSTLVVPRTRVRFGGVQYRAG